MAFNEVLAQRVRDLMSERTGVVELKMFGGLGFTVHGNMATGVYADDLIVRFDPHSDLADSPNTKPFDITGRAMRGWLLVTPSGTASDPDLERWVGVGADYAASLPPKNKG